MSPRKKRRNSVGDTDTDHTNSSPGSSQGTVNKARDLLERLQKHAAGLEMRMNVMQLSLHFHE